MIKDNYSVGSRVILSNLTDTQETDIRGTVIDVNDDEVICVECDNGDKVTLEFDPAKIQLLMSGKCRKELEQKRDSNVNMMLHYFETVSKYSPLDKEAINTIRDYIESLETGF
jgi:hypothetical protein